MPTARINDIDIYYEIYGSGFPLVLAYGLGGNTDMWAGQIDALPKIPGRSITGCIPASAPHVSGLKCRRLCQYRSRVDR